MAESMGSSTVTVTVPEDQVEGLMMREVANERAQSAVQFYFGVCRQPLPGAKINAPASPIERVAFFVGYCSGPGAWRKSIEDVEELSVS